MIYNNFALYYDQLMYDFDYDALYSFVVQILSMEEVKVQKILEMACGTGSITEKFAKDYYIDAFDNSEQMLSLAEEKLRGSKARLFKQDMRDFIPMDTYNVCLCLCDSLNYILEEEELAEIFHRVYGSLEEGGIFIFDLNTEEKFLNMDRLYVDEVEDIVYIWENEFGRTCKKNVYGVNFFRLRKDGLYERWYEEHIERAYDSKLILKFLKDSGFHGIKVYNGYKFDPNYQKAYRQVYIARR
ncbi:MAG: class I SAM-dependent methyltransferase [Tissierellia bacterium]|nr:class I SAM-dependent methyltransferase [Tissierellia bacterium]